MRNGNGPSLQNRCNPAPARTPTIITQSQMHRRFIPASRGTCGNSQSNVALTTMIGKNDGVGSREEHRPRFERSLAELDMFLTKSSQCDKPAKRGICHWGARGANAAARRHRSGIEMAGNNEGCPVVRHPPNAQVKVIITVKALVTSWLLSVMTGDRDLFRNSAQPS